MVYTDMTILAMKVAYAAHEGQVDRIGVPYIYHPIHLAEQMDTEDECVAALLHDVVEDTDITLEELRSKGFTDTQLEAVELLTHIPSPEKQAEEEKLEEYLDYVRRLKSNAIARKVKMADLRHNSDPERKTGEEEADLIRHEKYKKALDILIQE